MRALLTKSGESKQMRRCVSFGFAWTCSLLTEPPDEVQ